MPMTKMILLLGHSLRSGRNDLAKRAEPKAVTLIESLYARILFSTKNGLFVELNWSADTIAHNPEVKKEFYDYLKCNHFTFMNDLLFKPRSLLINFAVSVTSLYFMTSQVIGCTLSPSFVKLVLTSLSRTLTAA